MNKLLKVTLITAIMATSGMCGGYCDKPEFQHQYPQQLANTQYVPNCFPCIALTGGALAIGGVLIYTCVKGSCQGCCSGGDDESGNSDGDEDTTIVLNQDPKILGIGTCSSESSGKLATFSSTVPEASAVIGCARMLGKNGETPTPPFTFHKAEVTSVIVSEDEKQAIISFADSDTAMADIFDSVPSATKVYYGIWNDLKNLAGDES